MLLITYFGMLSICGHVNAHVDTGLLDQLTLRMERFEDRNRDLERTVKLPQDEIEALRQEVTSLKKTYCTNAHLSRNNRFIMDISEGPVGFTARIDDTYISHMACNDTIRFKHELLDIGDGYNNQTGVFTAPLPGIYMFSCSLLDHREMSDGSGVMVHAEIRQEGRTLARVFAHADGSGHRDQGAQTVVVQVKKGERVYVRIIDQTDLGLGGDKYSTFSGFMLWQLSS